MRATRLASVAAASFAMAAFCACQLLLPFEQGSAESDSGTADAPPAEAAADAAPGTDADADTAPDSDAAPDGHPDAAPDACVPGTCQPVLLASNQSTPTSLRIYMGEIYWGTNSGSGNSGIWHAPADGGTQPKQLVAAAWISGITVGPGGIYWADPGGVETYTDAGASTFVGMTNAQMVTSDDASVYWSDWGMNKPIYSQPFGTPAASPPMPLYTNTGTAFGLINVQGTLYWTVNDTNVMDGLVVFGDPTGGTATTAAMGQANPLGISVDGTGIYWANSGVSGGDAGAAEQAVWEKPNNGGPAYALATNLSHPVAVWADPQEQYVYWVEAGSAQAGYADGRVVRATKGLPTVVTVLATGQGQPADITGDGTSIYWANAGPLVDGGQVDNGQILKLPK